MKMQSIYVYVKLAENNCDFRVHKLLGIPRSSMWANISDLEKSLGKKLVNRKKQGLSFTAAGEEFIPYAQKIYQTYEESLASASATDASQIGGDLIISTTIASAHLWSMESIKKLYFESPHLRLHIVASDSLAREEENSSDILIRPYEDSDIFTKVWFTQYRHGLFASREYIEQMGMPKTPEDLATHRLVGYGEHKFSYFDDINWHLKGQDYGLPKLKPFLTINSTKAIYDAARHGLGICSISLESNEVYGSELVRILPDITGPTVRSFFCVKKSATGQKLNSINMFRAYYEKYLLEQGVQFIPTEEES
jgi:DNA-binding transcriptional LysR family regulator